MRGGSVNISGGTLTSDGNVFSIRENVNATVTITGTSTEVKGTGSGYSAINWLSGSSGTMTVGTSGSSSSYPKISGGISYDSNSNVTEKIYSGTVN